MGLLNNGAQDINTPLKLDNWKQEHDLFVTQADILRLEERLINFEIKLDLLLYYFREQLGEKTK